jgi:threonine synthase
MSVLTNLECSYCGKTINADKLNNLCPDCDKPLFARYDIKNLPSEFSPKSLQHRETTLWRYHEMLPVRDQKFRVSLGEGFTPLLPAQRLGKMLNVSSLFIKEEGVNPTTSFKARGLSVAISRAYELGVKEVSIPSAGNAAGAMSAYAARAGLQAFVFMPQDVPKAFLSECYALGAHVHLVDGLITDCGRVAREQGAGKNRFDISTLKEPYRLEGKKTMGYEIAEQLNWKLPDVIIYPTGGGTGLIGMWKAFEELEQLGWINSYRPRMVCVQSTGCAPMVKAFESGGEFADTWKNAVTIADGLRVPAAVGDFLILRTLRESNGIAVSVSDQEMLEGADLIGHTEGIFASPEAGATCAAFKKLLKSGWIGAHETVVIFNTGSGHKYFHLWHSIKQ